MVMDFQTPERDVRVLCAVIFSESSSVTYVVLRLEEVRLVRKVRLFSACSVNV